MPHAVVVGTDATALHVARRLAARGFDVTLLEASQKIGGQWVQRLLADRDECEFKAVEDGVFLDFPFHSGRASNSETKSLSDYDPNDESIGNASVQRRTVWVEPTKAPASGPPSEQQLLRHLADYAYAAGLHRSIRLGCTLRRAKWQAMNGCWRLELKTEPVVQRGGAQLSADLLVVSRHAVAGTRLPRMPGSELYCGTMLTANDQLSGPGGSAMLEQQLRGRNVLVVGPPSPVAMGWAEACRQHAGYGGSVVLLEVAAAEVAAEEEKEGATLGIFASMNRQCGLQSGNNNNNINNNNNNRGKAGLVSRLIGNCFGFGLGKQRDGTSCSRLHGAGSQRRHDGPPLERFSPAQAPFQGQGSGNGAGGDGVLLSSPEPGSGTSGTFDDAEGSTDDDLKSRYTGKVGDAGTEVLELDSELAAVGRLVESATGPALASATGLHTGGGGGEEEAAGTKQSRARRQEARDLEVAEASVAGPRGVHGRGGGNGGGGTESPLDAGRSSLRVIRGLGALLNGTHAMLSTGEEISAEVVLLVPLGGVETSLAFLDAGGPVRMSHAGGSSIGGSFKHAGTTSLAAASASLASMPETVSRQLDVLYRDILSNSPYAPNFALVGLGTRASQHDARTAAVQAAWLLATWAGIEDHETCPDVCGGRRDAGGNGNGGFDVSWVPGVPPGGFLRQASPVEAAADAALRLRWQREAAKRGAPELYQLRYMQQLLTDLGAAVQAPSRWRCGGCSVACHTPAPEHLTRQRVAKLLGLKRLRRQLQAAEEEAASPGRMLATSHNGSGVFATAHAAATAAAAGAGVGVGGIWGERGSGITSREASRSSHQGGVPVPVRQPTWGPQAMALRDRADGSRSAGGSFEMAVRGSEGSCPAFAFSSPGVDGQCGPGGMPSLQQLAEGCFSTGSFHSAHYQQQQQHNLHKSSNNNNNNSNNNNNNNNNDNNNNNNNNNYNYNSLSFARGSNQLTISHELQLYRVAEHPAEHLGDGPSSAAGLPPGGTSHHEILPSSPSNPSLALAAGMNTNAGSISSSIGSVRSRFLGASSASFSTPATAAGGATLVASASSVTTSPCALGGYYGAGGSDAGPGGTGPASVVRQLSGALTTPVALSGEDLSPIGGSQQRLRSQLLQRHRSTSRLAGVSNASSLPFASPQSPIMSNGTLSMFFGRRAPGVSTSQVSFEIPNSFLTESRSHGGRPLNTASHSSRRGPNMSAGGGNGAGSCSTGSPGLVGRANSAVRLQLLLAAASSASRRRTARLPASPASGASYEAQSYSPGGTGAGADSKLRFQATGCSDVLEPLPSTAECAAYGGRYGGGLGRAPLDGTPRRLGTSVAVLARAHRISNGPGNAHGSVSEPVAGKLVTSRGSEPGSPSRLLRPRKAYGSVSETVSEQLPAEAVAAAAAALAAMAPEDADEDEDAAAVSATATSRFITGEQQWSDGEPSFQVEERGSHEDGGISMESGSGAAPRNVRAGRHHHTRRRSITLPDLRFGGGYHLQHDPFHDPFPPEGDGYGEEDGGRGNNDDGEDFAKRDTPD